MRAELRSKRVAGIQDETLFLGKHKGKRFSQVQALDPGYCNWVTDQDDATGQLARFRQFILHGPSPAPAPPEAKGVRALAEELAELREAEQPGRAGRVLTRLASLKITKEDLRATGIGRELNKSFWKNHEVMGQKARDLISKWRALV